MATDLNQLQAAYTEALAASRANPTPETRAAAVAASNALSAATPARKTGPSRDMSPAARSGRRQQAEQRARTAENLRRAYPYTDGISPASSGLDDSIPIPF